jgi:cytidylate kinase
MAFVISKLPDPRNVLKWVEFLQGADGRKLFKIIRCTIFVVIFLSLAAYLAVSFVLKDSPYIKDNISEEMVLVVTICLGIFIVAMYVLGRLYPDVKSNAQTNIPTSKRDDEIIEKETFDKWLDYFDGNIHPNYCDKRSLTPSDLREYMSAILHLINKSILGCRSNVRTTIFLGRNDGRFDVLASDINPYRIPHLEANFRYAKQPGDTGAYSLSNKIQGLVGLCATKRKKIVINNNNDWNEECRGAYKETLAEGFPWSKTDSVLCLPVFPARSVKHDFISVLSISSADKDFFSGSKGKEIESRLREYVARIASALSLYYERSLFVTKGSSISKVRLITLSGNLSAGKTTISKGLLELLGNIGWKYINVGRQFEQFLEQENVERDRYKQYPPELLRKFDKEQSDILRRERNCIIEGRHSGYLAYKLAVDHKNKYGDEYHDILRVHCSAEIGIRSKWMAHKEDCLDELGVKKNLEASDERNIAQFRETHNENDYNDSKFYHLNLNTNQATSVLFETIVNAIKNFESE